MVPWAVAITPNGAFAYVTNESSDNVSVISTATNTVVATVPVVSGSYNSGPYAVANHTEWRLRLHGKCRCEHGFGD